MGVTKDRSKWPPGVVGIRNHSWGAIGKKSRIHWPMCKHCGLLALKNDATRRARRCGCYKWADE